MRFAPVVVLTLWLPAISSASDDLLKRGIGEYARGKFKQAVVTLTDAVQKGRDQKGIATARKYLAAVHAALGDPASAGRYRSGAQGRPDGDDRSGAVSADARGAI